MIFLSGSKVWVSHYIVSYLYFVFMTQQFTPYLTNVQGFLANSKMKSLRVITIFVFYIRRQGGLGVEIFKMTGGVIFLVLAYSR